jgi:hypothetical protein
LRSRDLEGGKTVLKRDGRRGTAKGRFFHGSERSAESRCLARAAAVFGNARSNYEQVLPDLESAYTTARDWERASFDPRAVARAELAWWVARRIPGQTAPEHVGELIADEYALLYGVARPTVMSAGVFRAQAGALRDAQADEPDWLSIEGLLEHSYLDLHRALAP